MWSVQWTLQNFQQKFRSPKEKHFDGLVQDYIDSIANAQELL